MRLLLICLVSISLFSQRSFAQAQIARKVYIFNPNRSIQPAVSSHLALQIRAIGGIGYTLIETDMDSLALISPSGQTVYLLLEPGKTYYFGQVYDSFLYQEITANAFWLSVAASSRSHRHYSITKRSGVVELKEGNH